jgi:hypothetical protein
MSGDDWQEFFLRDERMSGDDWQDLFSEVEQMSSGGVFHVRWFVYFEQAFLRVRGSRVDGLSGFRMLQRMWARESDCLGSMVEQGPCSLEQESGWIRILKQAGGHFGSGSIYWRSSRSVKRYRLRLVFRIISRTVKVNVEGNGETACLRILNMFIDRCFAANG